MKHMSEKNSVSSAANVIHTEGGETISVSHTSSKKSQLRLEVQEGLYSGFSPVKE